jgi:Phage integrase, N-terminal SAM-like domain
MPLLDDVRRVLRLRHYSCETEKCYVSWIERFMRCYKGADDSQKVGRAVT